jgi:UDP-N-acetylglucosamine 3-dehydrogenase
MDMLRAAIIGAGRPRRTEGCTGFGMAHFHAAGFKAAEDCDLIAVADIKPENAQAFADEHPGVTPYFDYKEMLRAEKPDIVAICLWDHLHYPVTLDCIEAGVKAIHCEKPMAPTFGESRRMVEAADREGVQLTFNHEMRFSKTLLEVKNLVDSQAIGRLARMETFVENLLDAGTHWIDLMFMFNQESPAEWVIGQIDSRSDRAIFGVRHEDQSIAHVRFQNGVDAIITTMANDYSRLLRLTGENGVIEIIWAVPPETDRVRIWHESRAGWQNIELAEGMTGRDMLVHAVRNGVVEVVESFRSGKRSAVDCHWALQAAEIIFAIYESSRRRARVDLPLDIDDSPFLSMLEKGQIGPACNEKSD